jgi:alpha-amylase
MAFRKGREGRHVVMVLSTQGSNSGAYTIRMMNGFQPSYVVIDVLSCRTWTVNDMGELRLDMDKGEPRVLYPEALMRGSGLCGFEEGKVSYLDFVNKSYTPPLTKEKVSSTGALGTRVVGGSWLALAGLLLGLVAFEI